MSTPSLTAEEIIAEVRSIARGLQLNRPIPGAVLPSIKQQIGDLLLTAGVPFSPWASGRHVLVSPGEAIVDGQSQTMDVHKSQAKGIRDLEPGRIAAAIASSLLLAEWQLLPQCHDWTPEKAEAEICKTAEQLPLLCDQLEQAVAASDDYRREADDISLFGMVIHTKSQTVTRRDSLGFERTCSILNAEQWKLFNMAVKHGGKLPKPQVYQQLPEKTERDRTNAALRKRLQEIQLTWNAESEVYVLKEFSG